MTLNDLEPSKKRFLVNFSQFLAAAHILTGCLHDPANVQQTSSKCIQNTRANAGRLLLCII